LALRRSSTTPAVSAEWQRLDGDWQKRDETVAVETDLEWVDGEYSQEEDE